MRLEAYHDGELGWWARQQLAIRLRFSAPLREELANLEALAMMTRELSPEPRGLNVWRGIEGAIGAIDGVGVHELHFAIGPGQPLSFLSVAISSLSSHHSSSRSFC